MDTVPGGPSALNVLNPDTESNKDNVLTVLCQSVKSCPALSDGVSRILTDQAVTFVAAQRPSNGKARDRFPLSIAPHSPGLTHAPTEAFARVRISGLFPESRGTCVGDSDGKPPALHAKFEFYPATNGVLKNILRHLTF